MSTKTGRTAAIVIIVSSIALLGAIIVGVSRDRSLTRHQQEGVIRIGYAVEAPYAFLKKGGEVTGESPEVARRIVARLGIRRIEWVQTEFGALIPDLESGRFDVIAAGMFITPERAKAVAFSEPTFHVKQGLLVPRGNPQHLSSYRQAVSQGNVRLAVISGAVEEALLQRLGMPVQRLVVVPDARSGLVAVESGMADGLALSSLTINWMARCQSLGRTEQADPFEQSESDRKGKAGYGAFAFKMDDRQLRSAWNTQLEAFIGTQEHLGLVAGFGITPAELPGTVTTAEVLSGQ